MQTDGGVNFDIIIPTFPVKDVGESIDHYVQELGFKSTLQDGDEYAHVKRGKAVIALYKLSSLQERAGCERFAPSSKARATVFVDGIEALHEEYKAKGVTVLDPPAEVPYGWDMQIADRDGHVIEFVQFRSA